MTTQQKEQLREVLIDYLQMLTSTVGLTRQPYEGQHDKRIAEIRLLLQEVV